MLTVIVFLLVFIIVLPAIIVIPQAFTSLNYFTYPIPEFVTKWIDKFWENSEWVVGLTRSLVIAVIVAVVATVLGTLAAVAMQKLEFKGKGLFMGLMISPMVIPVVIIGVALYSTFSKVGLTNTFTGLILTHTLLALPMVFVTMSSGLGGVNPNLELAAMSMGSLISSVLFSFVTSLDEVAASLFISGADTKTLPLVMWERLNTYMDPTIAVAAMYLIILTLGTYIVKEIIAYRSRRIG